jgi:hypothetical protein
VANPDLPISLGVAEKSLAVIICPCCHGVNDIEVGIRSTNPRLDCFERAILGIRIDLVTIATILVVGVRLT